MLPRERPAPPPAPETPIAALTRLVAIYGDGPLGAEAGRARELCARATLPQLRALALRARAEWGFRHAALFLCREMARHASPVDRGAIADAIAGACVRPEDVTTFLALYWSGGTRKLAAQVKRGVARALQRIDPALVLRHEDRGPVALAHAIVLCRPKPPTDAHSAAWKATLARYAESRASSQASARSTASSGAKSLKRDAR